MLTPIKTRGRRKRSWTPSDGVSKPIPSGPKGGRPMMSLRTKQANSQSSNKRARLVAQIALPKPRKNLSRLESLPVELIEKIFLYSLNVNLPRSSRFLAAALSSERIYRALTLLAFWDDSSARDSGEAPETAKSIELAAATEAGATKILRLLRPLEYVPLFQDERRSLQASVLRCRWCTIERLLSHLPDLVRLVIQRHWLNVDITMASDLEDTLCLFLAQKGDTCSFQGTDTNSNHYTMTIEPLVSLTISCLESEQQTTHRILGILQIPDRFLSGTDKGFNEPHVRFLEILRLASGFNRLEPSTATEIALSREAIQQGVHTALIEHNADALTTLLKIDEYTFRSENTSAIQTLPYMLPPEHFRTAVRVARDDPSLFQLLLRASAESVPADDSEITQWAMDLDDAFGPWLLDFMLQLPQRIEAAKNEPIEGPIFYFGRANSRISIAQRYLRDVLGLEEMAGWMEEKLLNLSSEWMIE
ncbi:hypothetical protein BDW59DRAFT_143282 [Aspergillus cavernicola]|uniref:F-box domain-containing protein n=1 Tax=Aspergillus cavernicola TaxID=176166 RepID=A0ABR4IK58_9EURO